MSWVHVRRWKLWSLSSNTLTVTRERCNLRTADITNLRFKTETYVNAWETSSINAYTCTYSSQKWPWLTCRLLTWMTRADTFLVYMQMSATSHACDEDLLQPKAHYCVTTLRVAVVWLHTWSQSTAERRIRRYPRHRLPVSETCSYHLTVQLCPLVGIIRRFVIV